MWIVPSRSRPHNINRLIGAFADTAATTPVLVRVDEDDEMLGGYREIDYPHNWSLVVGRPGLLSEIYNDIYRVLPDLFWYGFLADDVVPETEIFDRLLISAAGSNGLAFGDDSINGPDHAPHFVIGGDLVREFGFLSLPGLSRIYIDTVWNDIAREKGVYRYLSHVHMPHYHFSNRRALFDQTYRKPDKEADKRIYQAWKERQCSSIPETTNS